MKKFLVFLLAVCTTELYAQQGWYAQSSGTTATLYAVSFTDAITGTVVGSGGTILRTTDGGTTWTPQRSGTTEHLRKVSFTDASRGTVVGHNGTILRTTDGGTTWTQQSSGTTIGLTGVSFTDANNGFVVGSFGGTILRTTDGGATWTSLSTGTVSQAVWNLTDIHFTDANTGTLVGSFYDALRSEQFGLILRTTDGGASWTSRTVGDCTGLIGVFFVDTDAGFALSTEDEIYHTTDGGLNWTEQSTVYVIPKGVFFADADNGFVVGGVDPPPYEGRIMRTTDGGETWNPQQSGTTNFLLGVCFTDANTGTAVGGFGTIFRTTTGGTTWVQEKGTSQTPNHFGLEQNYPNPFNPSTTIEFSLPRSGYVMLQVFNILGEAVATLVNEELNVGTYTTQWNASDATSGVYLYRLQANEFLDTKKLLLLR